MSCMSFGTLIEIHGVQRYMLAINKTNKQKGKRWGDFFFLCFFFTSSLSLSFALLYLVDQVDHPSSLSLFPLTHTLSLFLSQTIIKKSRSKVVVKLSFYQSINQSTKESNHQSILKEKGKGNQRRCPPLLPCLWTTSLPPSSSAMFIATFATLSLRYSYHCLLANSLLIHYFHLFFTFGFCSTFCSPIRVSPRVFLFFPFLSPWLCLLHKDDVFHYGYFFWGFFVLCYIGQCSLHKFVQDCNSSMWALHQSFTSEHARVASAFG